MQKAGSRIDTNLHESTRITLHLTLLSSFVKIRDDSRKFVIRILVRLISRLHNVLSTPLHIPKRVSRIDDERRVVRDHLPIIRSVMRRDENAIVALQGRG